MLASQCVPLCGDQSASKDTFRPNYEHIEKNKESHLLSFIDFACRVALYDAR